jgi:hypothetical protein
MSKYSIQKLAHNNIALMKWWNALPISHKRGYYFPKELEAYLGRSMRAMAGMLRIAGWVRVKVPVKERGWAVCTVWLTPRPFGKRPLVRPRGQPHHM